VGETEERLVLSRVSQLAGSNNESRTRRRWLSASSLLVDVDMASAYRCKPNPRGVIAELGCREMKRAV
jgi:hypothetical protein